MNKILIKNMISEFGCLGTFKMCMWRIAYRMGHKDKTTVKKMCINSLQRDVYFRPYSTDILLILNLFCRSLSDGGMEYRIDFSDVIEDAKTIVDAGANIGLFTLLYKMKYPSAKFICIEPDVDNFEILKKNVMDYEDVECVLGGVWKCDTFLKIVDRGTGEWGFAVEECEKSESSCQGYSVKSVFELFHVTSVDIFKMDIEGSEEDVFEINYESWIESVDSYIIETHDRIRPGVEKKLISLFEVYNYRFVRNGENIIFIRGNGKDGLDI